MTIMNPIQTIASDLLALGVRPGVALLVHSSLRSLGPVPGGAETVVRGLLEGLGPRGTLLMPALSYESVGPTNAVFDVRSTPSCVGALPEYFRTRPGTVRSVHPTHSMCGVGRQVQDLLNDHALSITPCGQYSPFYRLPHINGQILFLGCGLNPNTSMHAIEELVEPPYLYGDPITYQVIMADNSELQMSVRSHNFKGWAQRYDRLEVVMRRGLRTGKLLQADCHLVDSEEMWPAALEALKKDPLYFVEKIEP
jgi:aminoglycoside 3-N-acetyltransferase